MNIGLTFLGVLLFITSVFMMMLILVQRGKGGGLTGALGGMGGQSAFGAKAGDVFTRITVVTAIIWITLCMITIAAFNPPPSNAGLNSRDEVTTMSSGDEEESDETATDEEGASEDSDNGSDAKSVDEELENFIGDDDSSEDEAATEGESVDASSEETESNAPDAEPAADEDGQSKDESGDNG